MSDPTRDPAANFAAIRSVIRTRPTDVPGVIDRLERIAAIAATLEPRREDDGVACFTRLYRDVTSDVWEAAQRGDLFRCPGGFILDLDLAFAGRYFDALDTHADGGSPAPGCWWLLFARRRRELAPWRFAAAGVNAHVTFDLAFALLDVWEQRPPPPGTIAEQEHDYRAINEIFRRRMDRFCADFDAPWSDILGDGSFVDRAGNVFGQLLVVGTRHEAWERAIEMWDDRGEPGDDSHRVRPTARMDDTATGYASALLRV